MAIRTARLAEIYASQGHLEEALGIYVELAGAQPEDEGLRARCSALRARLAAQATRLNRGVRLEKLRTLKTRIRARRRAS